MLPARRPRVEEIVHYSSVDTTGTHCRAALIADIISDRELGLAVIDPFDVTYATATFDTTGAPGTWHWPEAS